MHIGASQKPLEGSFFKDKFGITEDVSIEQTDGWYRYTVGNFKSYKAARDYAQTQSKIEGAFVVKYENGQRILPQGVSTNEPTEYTNNTNNTNNINTNSTSFAMPITAKGIYYRVQIGSSGKKLTSSFFKDSFGINDYIYEEQIEGQFKYTVGHFKTYKEAKKFSETITNVQGAFVTSYRDNLRIPLQEAIGTEK